MSEEIRSAAAMAGFADTHELVLDATVAMLAAQSEEELRRAEKRYVGAVRGQLGEREKRALGMIHDTRLALLLTRRML